MKNTRIGKIARLPKAVREVLGDRLEAGEKAAAIVSWRNARPRCS